MDKILTYDESRRKAEHLMHCLHQWHEEGAVTLDDYIDRYEEQVAKEKLAVRARNNIKSNVNLHKCEAFSLNSRVMVTALVSSFIGHYDIDIKALFEAYHRFKIMRQNTLPTPKVVGSQQQQQSIPRYTTIGESS